MTTPDKNLAPIHRIAVFYGHVASNIGDLAINVGTIHAVRACWPNAAIDFVLLDAQKSKFLETSQSSFDGEGQIVLHHLVPDLRNALSYLHSPEALLSQIGIEQPDMILLASGEHLFDYGNGENIKSLFWRMLPALTAAQLNIPCLQMPATLGPFHREQTQDLVGAFLDCCTSVGIRDTESLAQMATLFPDKTLALLPDPAYAIDTPSKKKKPTGKVGFIMRSEGWGIRLAAAKRKEMTGAFRATQFTKSRSFQLTLALMERILSETEDEIVIFVQTFADRQLGEHLHAIATDLGAGSRVTLEEPTTVLSYMESLRDLDRIFASRFHAVILALSVGTPSFGIYFQEHGHKMPGMFTLLEQPQACVNGSTLDPDVAAETLLTASQDMPEVPAVLRTRLQHLRDQMVTWIKTQAHTERRGHAAAAERLFTGLEALVLTRRRRVHLKPELEEQRQEMAEAEAALLLKEVSQASVILDYGLSDVADLSAHRSQRLVFSVDHDQDRVRRWRARFGEQDTAGYLIPYYTDQGNQTPVLWNERFMRAPDLVLIDPAHPDKADTLACLHQLALRSTRPARVILHQNVITGLPADLAAVLTPVDGAGNLQVYAFNPVQAPQLAGDTAHATVVSASLTTHIRPNMA